ncbi:CBS domain-containing protein [Photobacterium lipolyticum]|uniref:CBS domain-containing protein n=1 Tax=Photobacterium lipolyticum TaxID=266810 RepID=A0A2T3MZ79_9GAMM|nr:CBS domain-containing protein [Photobacterium lipolyticum]PSW05264.1 CBS domain-containing protein [Photobacterium lipolyticum]
MTAGVYCNRQVVITGPDTTISEVAKLMREYHVGNLIVAEKQGDKNVPLGIITDRDLVLLVLAPQISVDSVSVKDVMSSPLVTVKEELGLFDTLDVMHKHGMRRLPVVNERGGLEGIITADDVLGVLAEATNSLMKLTNNEIKHEQETRS